jgi:hypothetical protein
MIGVGKNILTSRIRPGLSPLSGSPIKGKGKTGAPALTWSVATATVGGV